MGLRSDSKMKYYFEIISLLTHKEATDEDEMVFGGRGGFVLTQEEFNNDYYNILVARNIRVHCVSLSRGSQGKYNDLCPNGSESIMNHYIFLHSQKE